jgi:hypothetical protein
LFKVQYEADIEKAGYNGEEISKEWNTKLYERKEG